MTAGTSPPPDTLAFSTVPIGRIIHAQGDFGQINLADDESCDFQYNFLAHHMESPHVVSSRILYTLYFILVGSYCESSHSCHMSLLMRG